VSSGMDIVNMKQHIVTGAIKGTSKGRLLNELCWEDLKTRRYLHKMFFSIKLLIFSVHPTYVIFCLYRLVKDLNIHCDQSKILSPSLQKLSV
jgi:hypothetical protein